MFGKLKLQELSLLLDFVLPTHWHRWRAYAGSVGLKPLGIKLKEVKFFNFVQLNFVSLLETGRGLLELVVSSDIKPYGVF